MELFFKRAFKEEHARLSWSFDITTRSCFHAFFSSSARQEK